MTTFTADNCVAALSRIRSLADRRPPMPAIDFLDALGDTRWTLGIGGRLESAAGEGPLEHVARALGVYPGPHDIGADLGIKIGLSIEDAEAFGRAGCSRNALDEDHRAALVAACNPTKGE